MKSRGIQMVFGIIILATVSAVVMLLWNLLMPSIFGLTTINYWQALGLFVLSRILFGRLGFGRNHWMRGRMDHNSIHNKWMEMTPEQREEFINRRRQFGFGHSPFGRSRFDTGKQEEQENGNK